MKSVSWEHKKHGNLTGTNKKNAPDDFFFFVKHNL